MVSYSTEKLLKGCQGSVYRGADGTPTSIWVVDNNSHDDSVPMVKSHFPKVQVIESQANVGFSRSCRPVVSRNRSDCLERSLAHCLCEVHGGRTRIDLHSQL